MEVASTASTASTSSAALVSPVEDVGAAHHRIAVFGSGMFGTALATCLARNGHSIKLLTRNPVVCESINTKHVNPVVLSSFTLPDSIVATLSAEEALADCEYIVHVIPVQASPEYLQRLRHLIPPHVPIISASKGIHAERLQYMSDLVPAVLERDQPTAYLSGPSFAKELLDYQPTSLVAASRSPELATAVQRLFVSRTLRVYTTTDVIGVEVGGALKNVFALAAGCLEGLGFGMNSMAMLVTRGCSEMRKLAIAMGSRAETLAGLSGIGDLMLTCYGSLSRNRTVGKRLGEGEKLEDILASMTEVAEGVATSQAAAKLAQQYHLDLPIVMTVATVISGELSAKEAVMRLMMIPMGAED